MIVLVDTSFWFGLLDASDERHDAAKRLEREVPGRRLITQPCLVEIVTLISAQGDPRRAAEVGRQFRLGKPATIVEITSADEAAGFELMEKFVHLRLSYADATACALVRRLDIPRVLTFDSDFKIVLPEREVVGPA